MSAGPVLDLDTAEGVSEWVRTLPDANLRAIAARPVFYGPASNLLIVTAAECELIVRGLTRVDVTAEHV